MPYILVSVSAVVYMRRQEPSSFRAHHAVTAAAAVALLMMSIVGSVYPVPDWPMNILPFVFMGVLALGVGRYLYVRKVHPHRLVDGGLDD